MCTVELNLLTKFTDLNIAGLMQDVKITQEGLFWRYRGKCDTNLTSDEFIAIAKQHADFIHTTADMKRCMKWTRLGNKRVFVDAYCDKLRISTHAFVRGQLKELSHEFIRIKEME